LVTNRNATFEKGQLRVAEGMEGSSICEWNQRKKKID
jgi:hypothetical protein